MVRGFEGTSDLWVLWSGTAGVTLVVFGVHQLEGEHEVWPASGWEAEP